MATAADLLGVWKPEAMADPGTKVFDVLVFKEDGDGFLDFSDPQTEYFCEQFRWSIDPPNRLRLRGYLLKRFNADRTGVVEGESSLDAGVSFSVRTEHTRAGRRTQVLRMGTCPWSGLSNHALVGTCRYQCHDATYATFQAPCFELEEEAREITFRGKALSDHLAEQLERRRVPVGERYEVFMGCCYHRSVTVGGQKLGLSVNWDRELHEWWVCVHPPAMGGKAEADELVALLDDILRRVGGLQGLEWHSEEQWLERHGRPRRK
jgi:hypothetical protein